VKTSQLTTLLPPRKRVRDLVLCI